MYFCFIYILCMTIKLMRRRNATLVLNSINPLFYVRFKQVGSKPRRFIKSMAISPGITLLGKIAKWLAALRRQFRTCATAYHAIYLVIVFTVNVTAKCMKFLLAHLHTSALFCFGFILLPRIGEVPIRNACHRPSVNITSQQRSALNNYVGGVRLGC